MCNLYSNGEMTIKHLNLGCVFWENPKTDLWSPIIWILHYQKTEGSIKGSFTMTATCPRAHRGQKQQQQQQQQQTDPRGEDKKEKQYKLRMNIRNVYISAETHFFSNRVHLRIVKL